MNPPTPALTNEQARLSPFAATSYEAFRISEGRTDPLRLDGAGSLQDAVQSVQALCLHGEHLMIRETDARGDRLRLFAIKRKAMPNYEYDSNHIMRRVQTLYAAPVCVIDATRLDARPTPAPLAA